jgi:succinate-acetate transporter protein
MTVTRPEENPAPLRVVLRPLASPLALGFFGLAGATVVVSGLQLGWVDPHESTAVALCLLGFTVPLQFTASILSFHARDAVAATGMGLLSGIWAAIALVMLTVEPATTSDALGLLLLIGGVAIWAPAAGAAAGKLIPAAVLTLAGLRFVLTGVYQLSADEVYEDAAGLVGLGLAALAVYAAYAAELEDALERPLLPLGRRSAHARAITNEGTAAIMREPGVRQEL